LTAQEVAGGLVDLVPLPQGCLQRRAPEVEIAILQPHLFPGVDLVVERERRGLGLVEDTSFDHLDLDLARSEIGVRGADHLVLFFAELFAA
jgi:hypothetical protein